MLESFSSKIIVIFITIILFSASLFLFFWTLEKNNISRAIKKSIQIDLTKELNNNIDESLVSVSGVLKADDPFGDLYLKKGNYVVLRRNVEMYSWRELWEAEGEGGIKFFSYEKEWTKRPDDSSRFKIRGKHINPKKEIDDKVFYSENAYLEGYQVNVFELDFLEYEKVKLTKGNVVLLNGYNLINQEYLYKGSGSLANPRIGDLRMSYLAIKSPSCDINIIGRFGNDSQTIYPYYLKDKTKIYIASFGSNNELRQDFLEINNYVLWLIRLASVIILFSAIALFFRFFRANQC